MKRVTVFIYGLIAYGLFQVAFAYAVGFLADAVVPTSVDVGPSASFSAALVIDLALLTAFAVQHTIMARQGFKRALTKVIPQAAERSTFVLASSLVLLLLCWQWRPIPAVLWNVASPAGRVLLWAVYGFGWVTVVGGTYMISHGHLFGVRQAWEQLRDRTSGEPKFQTRWLYRYVRHPLMLGFLIAFWATPTMTVGHLVFAGAATGYIFVGTLLFEERDLEKRLGEPYRRYRASVPAFVPRPGRSVPRQTGAPSAMAAQASSASNAER